MRSLIILFVLALTACSEDSRQPVYPKNRDLQIKLVQGDYDPKDIGILCIDGIKYLVTQQGGISPKFQAWNDTDPTVEECE